MQSAIRAWKDTDVTVRETDGQVSEEGLFILAAKATDLGTGYFHYEYAVQNLSSDRSGGSFVVPLPVGAQVENAGFHDEDYHDGDGVGCDGVCNGGSSHGRWCCVAGDCPNGACIGATRHINFDGTDWPATQSPGRISWSTTPYAEDSNANALRWGTLYNFRFDANVPPGETTVFLGLFKPGFPSDLAFRTLGPEQAFIDCNQNERADLCDVNCAGIGCQAPCGTSEDCEPNGVPDECEANCNGNFQPDACDIADGLSPDCNANNVPDECEPDCDDDGIIDDCELIDDTDGDSVSDCIDLCPFTTPAGACLPPFNQIVNCCLQNDVLLTGSLTWNQCFASFGIPVCDDPPVCPGTRCPESLCRDGCLFGDFDRDGDIDLFDMGSLTVCFSASTGIPSFVVPSAECLLRFDFDTDADVDLEDFDAFSAVLEGP